MTTMDQALRAYDDGDLQAVKVLCWRSFRELEESTGEPILQLAQDALDLLDDILEEPNPTPSPLPA